MSVRISRRSSSRSRTFVGHLVEHLGRVGARLALELGDERDLVEVAAVHPVRGDAERLVERDAELLVGDHTAELALRRLGRVVDGDGERPDEAVAGAERGRDDVEVLGQLVAEVAPHRARRVA